MTFLRRAIGDADRDTVERHGGLDPVTGKTLQSEEERVASAVAGLIDDFRLWRSGRCRQTNAPPATMATSLHPFDHPPKV